MTAGSSPSAPQLLSQKVWTSWIFPIAPARIIVSNARCDGADEIWMPICDTSRCARAYSASLRVSRIVAASGFCTYTCSPIRMAAIAIGRVHVIGRGHVDRVEVLALLVQQLAPVLVDARLRELLLDSLHAREIDVRHGDELESRDASRSW